MATWKKALVVGLAVLVGTLPVFARVDVGLPGSTSAAQQASTLLPEGKELGDDELLQAEGEIFILWVLLGAAAAGAAGGAIYEKRFDEDPGVIDRDDRRSIAGWAATGATMALVKRAIYAAF